MPSIIDVGPATIGQQASYGLGLGYWTWY